jgi:hypothetical protein
MADTIVAVYQTDVRGVTYVWASGRETWQDRATGAWLMRTLYSPADIAAHHADPDTIRATDGNPSEVSDD